MALPHPDPVVPPVRRWPRLRAIDPQIWDALLAAAFMAGCLTITALNDSTDSRVVPADAFAYVAVIVITGSLAFRRRFTVVAFLVSVVGDFAYEWRGYPDAPLAFAVLIQLYTVASIGPRIRGVAATATIVVAYFLLWLTVPRTLNLSDLFSSLTVFLVAAAVGDGVRLRRLYLHQLELRAEDLVRSQKEMEERAVANERLRIARELHDVVAHAMSVIAVQSGVGAHVVEQRPGEVKPILEHINQTSRDALAEMRRMLGVLRAEDASGDAALAPAPTLAGVDELAASIRSAGVPVTVEVEGERNGVPAGVDLSAYRIVQEALTNVLKHAGPASAQVHVRYEAHEVVVDVRDDGRGAAERPAPDPSLGGGHGLPGMRERVALYGGTLEAGPRAGGGFRVNAVLPYDEPSNEPSNEPSSEPYDESRVER